MPDASKNVAIGVLVSIALVLLLWVLLFLHPSFGDGKFILHVRFADIEKVNCGTRVTYAGRPIGEVVKIALVPETEREPSKTSDTIYTYDLTLGLDSHVPLYNSDEITIGTSGLMGERFISIIPKRLSKNVAQPLAMDEVVYASKAASVEDAFELISKVAVKAEETITNFSGLIKDNREQIGSTVESINSAAKQLDQLLKKTNEANLVARFSNAATQFERTMQAVNKEELVAKISSTVRHLDSIANSLDQPEQLKTLVTAATQACKEIQETSKQIVDSWPKVDQALTSFSNASETANQLIGRVAGGQGTIGRFLASDDFYLKTVAILNKADTMMNDVNRYGVLFHLDKGWQRDRRRTSEELAKLQNPAEFKAYINDEMNKITTAVGRLGQALEKAESVTDSNSPIVAQGEFVRTFTDLLSQIQDLQGTLKAYSIDLADKKSIQIDHIAEEN